MSVDDVPCDTEVLSSLSDRPALELGIHCDRRMRDVSTLLDLDLLAEFRTRQYLRTEEGDAAIIEGLRMRIIREMHPSGEMSAEIVGEATHDTVTAGILADLTQIIEDDLVLDRSVLDGGERRDQLRAIR